MASNKKELFVKLSLEGYAQAQQDIKGFGETLDRQLDHSLEKGRQFSSEYQKLLKDSLTVKPEIIAKASEQAKQSAEQTYKALEEASHKIRELQDKILNVKGNSSNNLANEKRKELEALEAVYQEKAAKLQQLQEKATGIKTDRSSSQAQAEAAEQEVQRLQEHLKSLPKVELPAIHHDEFDGALHSALESIEYFADTYEGQINKIANNPANKGVFNKEIEEIGSSFDKLQRLKERMLKEGTEAIKAARIAEREGITTSDTNKSVAPFVSQVAKESQAIIDRVNKLYDPSSNGGRQVNYAKGAADELNKLRDNFSSGIQEVSDLAPVNSAVSEEIHKVEQQLKEAQATLKPLKAELLKLPESNEISKTLQKQLDAATKAAEKAKAKIDAIKAQPLSSKDDKAVKDLEKELQELIKLKEKSAQEYKTAIKGITNPIAANAPKLADGQGKALADNFKAIQEEAKRTAAIVSQAYKSLNVQTDDSIQNQKDQFFGAFNAIKNSGVASAREISAAYHSLQENLQKLDESLDVTASAFRKLGVDSNRSLDTLEIGYKQAFNSIKNDALSTTEDILRAEEALNKKLTELANRRATPNQGATELDKTVLDKNNEPVDLLKPFNLRSAATIEAEKQKLFKAYQDIRNAGIHSQEDIERASKKLKSELQALDKELGKEATEWDKVGKEADKANKKSSAGLNKVLEDLGKMPGNIAKSLVYAAAISTAFNAWNTALNLFTGTVDAFKNSIKAVYDEASKTETILARLKISNEQDSSPAKAGEQAAQQFKELEQFARKSSIPVNDLTEAYITLKNRGLDPTIKTLTQLNDINQSLGKEGTPGLIQLVQAITDLSTGTSRSLQEQFNIDIQKISDLPGKVIATNKGYTQIFDESVQGAQELLNWMSQLPGVAGTTEEKFKTLEGSMNNLQELLNWMSQLPGVAGTTEEKFKTLEGSMNNLVNLGQELVRKVGLALAPAFQEVTLFAQDFVRELTDSNDASAQLAKYGEQIRDWFKQHNELAKTLAHALKELLEKIFSKLAKQAENLANYLERNPDAIDKATESAKGLLNIFEKVLNATKGIWKIITWLPPGISNVRDAILKAAGKGLNELGKDDTSQDSSNSGSAASKVVQTALARNGERFQDGVAAQCANWVRSVLEQAGVKVGVTNKPFDGQPTSAGMASSFFGNDIGHTVSKMELQPGDLVAFGGTYGGYGKNTITHTGIYVGNGLIVDRSTSSAPVRKRSIDTFEGPNSGFLYGIRPKSYGDSPTSAAKVNSTGAVAGSGETEPSTSKPKSDNKPPSSLSKTPFPTLEATFYGTTEDGLIGHKTANGETMDPNKLTAALNPAVARRLGKKMGDSLVVYDPVSKKSVRVRVNDVADDKTDIDLSLKAFTTLSPSSKGRLKVQIIPEESGTAADALAKVESQKDIEDAKKKAEEERKKKFTENDKLAAIKEARIKQYSKAAEEKLVRDNKITQTQLETDNALSPDWLQPVGQAQAERKALDDTHKENLQKAQNLAKEQKAKLDKKLSDIKANRDPADIDKTDYAKEYQEAQKQIRDLNKQYALDLLKNSSTNIGGIKNNFEPLNRKELPDLNRSLQEFLTSKLPQTPDGQYKVGVQDINSQYQPTIDTIKDKELEYNRLYLKNGLLLKQAQDDITKAKSLGLNVSKQQAELDKQISNNNFLQTQLANLRLTQQQVQKVRDIELKYLQDKLHLNQQAQRQQDIANLLTEKQALDALYIKDLETHGYTEQAKQATLANEAQKIQSDLDAKRIAHLQEIKALQEQIEQARAGGDNTGADSLQERVNTLNESFAYTEAIADKSLSNIEDQVKHTGEVVGVSIESMTQTGQDAFRTFLDDIVSAVTQGNKSIGDSFLSLFSSITSSITRASKDVS